MLHAIYKQLLLLLPPSLQVPASKTWPAFSWLEPSAPPLTGNSYKHWGKASPQNQAEPNNQLRDENCAVANYSQKYQGGEMQAWGWSDAKCSTKATFICKVARESPQQAELCLSYLRPRECACLCSLMEGSFMPGHQPDAHLLCTQPPPSRPPTPRR
jgi:hypothetical protein